MRFTNGDPKKPAGLALICAQEEHGPMMSAEVQIQPTRAFVISKISDDYREIIDEVNNTANLIGARIDIKMADAGISQMLESEKDVIDAGMHHDKEATKKAIISGVMFYLSCLREYMGVQETYATTSKSLMRQELLEKRILPFLEEKNKKQEAELKRFTKDYPHQEYINQLVDAVRNENPEQVSEMITKIMSNGNKYSVRDSDKVR